MKKIEWLSEGRIIPDHGEAASGSVICLPTELADKFISQGDARAVQEPKIQTEKRQPVAASNPQEIEQ